MPDQPTSQGADGVVVKIPGTKAEISASQSSIATLERAYEQTLQWADQDKPEFFTVAGLVALVIVLRFVRKRSADRMKRDFNETRQKAQQPQLPHIDELPSSGKRPRR